LGQIFKNVGGCLGFVEQSKRDRSFSGSFRKYTPTADGGAFPFNPRAAIGDQSNLRQGSATFLG
jgi:hypothetical protein